jgi:hypothetical protein
MAIGEVLGNGNPDGTNFGRATDKIGFYGLASPIVKPTLTIGVTVTSATATLCATDILAIKVWASALGLAT